MQMSHFLRVCILAIIEIFLPGMSDAHISVKCARDHIALAFWGSTFQALAIHFIQ